MKIYDRRTKEYEEIVQFGAGKLDFLYNNPFGRLFLGIAVSSFVSDIYSKKKSKKSSCKDIPEFIRNHNIDMGDYEESGDGFTAISYNHKNGKTMMKLYAPFVPISEPHRELEVAWNLADKGLNIPHAHRLVTDGTRIGVEFERISPKKSFARAISQEPETLLARECKKLHAIPCDTKLFSPTENRFRAAITKLKEYSDEEKAKISAFIDSVPKATTCIHGDMHIGNIITNGEKNFWIDLSAFSYGNPLYDVGMLYFVSHTGDDELAQKLFHISAAQMLEVWTYFVPEYFGKEEPLASIDEKVKPFAALLMLMYYTWTGNPPAGMFELVKHSILEKF